MAFVHDRASPLAFRELRQEVEIAQQYSSISLADVYSVLTYYLRHKTEVAAYRGRIIVTHDISTLAKHAFERIAAGQPMPGFSR